MSAIKFEVIKRNAGRELTERMHIGSPFPTEAHFLALWGGACGPKFTDPHKLLDEWHAKGQQMIASWDVRCVDSLVKCFPSAVPKNWEGRKLTAYIADNANSDWMVELAP